MIDTDFRLCKPVQSWSFAVSCDVGWSLRRAGGWRRRLEPAPSGREAPVPRHCKATLSFPPQPRQGLHALRFTLGTGRRLRRAGADTTLKYTRLRNVYRKTRYGYPHIQEARCKVFHACPQLRAIGRHSRRACHWSMKCPFPYKTLLH
jgi:hypothetical protein